MNWSVTIGGALGLLLFLPLCIGILRKQISQNPLTFLLWSLLDGIAAMASWLEGGNYLQALLFCLGGLAVLACILTSDGRFVWGRFEMFIIALVVICMIIWRTAGNTMAVLASVTALFIASIPQMKDAWFKPKEIPTWIYFGYMVSNLLAALGGKEISIVEISYPASGLLACTIIWALSLRK